MIKEIQEIHGEINRAQVLRQPEKIRGILQDWAESIVQACQDNFECTMEKCIQGEWYDEMYDDNDGDPCHPVLVRASIEAVKKQIQ